MTTIYRLDYDAFNHTYQGCWSSIDEAISKLPDCTRFRRALRWNMGRDIEDGDTRWLPDHDHNHTIRPVITKISDIDLEVVCPGFRWFEVRYTVTPEVKIPGQPYQPETRKSVNVGFKLEDRSCGYIRVRAIKLDAIGGGYE